MACQTETIVGQILHHVIETTVDKSLASQAETIVGQILQLAIDTAVDRSFAAITDNSPQTSIITIDDESDLSDSSGDCVAISSSRSYSGASTSSRSQLDCFSTGSAKGKVILLDDESSTSSSSKVFPDCLLVQSNPVWKIKRLVDRRRLYACTFPDLEANLSQIHTIHFKKFFRLAGQREQKRLPGQSVPVELLVSFSVVDLFPPKVNVCNFLSS
jgi:hypothetical protein